MPQVVVEAALQVSPVQQPVGQVVALQTHAPPTHFDPGLQAGPVPQPHAPPAHVSATVASQVVQPPPPVPQAVTELLQTFPAQQPDAHDVALQTQAPPTHA